MEGNWRLVHYMNQFFAGVGGEEKARVGLSSKSGPVGMGNILQEALKGNGSVEATLFCGDDYFVENQDEVVEQALRLIIELKPDIFIAGPAFNAGRYGQACGALCSTVQRRLGIPAITGMYVENPGVDLYRKEIYIIETPNRAMNVPELLNKMIELGIRLARGVPVGTPSEGGYIPRGVKKNMFVNQTGAVRAINMLLNKLRNRPFSSEIHPPTFDAVPPAFPIRDLAESVIALVTDGGIVPVGNPDGIRGAAGNTFGKYSIKELNDLKPDAFTCIHGGMDKRIASADPKRFIPIDVLRDMEREGRIRRLHEWVYSTAGCTMELQNAVKIGKDIARDLKNTDVRGVILTSA
jgi:betaine reductase